MRIYANSWWLPKRGNTAEEYEDACWPRDLCSGPCAAFRCAVADGATETSFSGLWARLLVRAHGRGRLTPRGLPEALRPLQREWRRRVSATPLPWYAEQKADQGAYAALAGLTLTAPCSGRGGGWHALAVGDSCVFQLRGGGLVATLPVACSADFTSRPALLSSDAAANEGLAGRLTAVSGEWAPGDTFYLMTDALAQWFLHNIEDGRRPSPLPREPRAAVFEEWIGDLRARGEIRNDDVTLVRVEVEA